MKDTKAKSAKKQPKFSIEQVKIMALTKFLGDEDQQEAERLIDNGDYLVLTDEEADEKAKEYILDSVWGFNSSFLSCETGIDEEVFKAIQDNGRCESNNSAILSMIDDEEGFIKSAISADGRGHFMSSYDGYENEETINGETFYIYRIN